MVDPVALSRKTAWIHLLVWAGLAVPAIARDAPWFLAGDADSSGTLDVSDAVRILLYLFSSPGQARIACMEAADTNDSGEIDLGDAVVILNYLFLRGRPPRRASAYDLCVRHDVRDGLSCEDPGPCLAFDRLLWNAGAVVFVLDRSETMGNSGELAVSQRELIELVCGLKPEVYLGLVVFDASQAVFPPDGKLLPAEAETKPMATEVIRTANAGPGACPDAALLTALEMLDAADTPSKAILFLSDGGADCPGFDDANEYRQETLAWVVARNAGRVSIHTAGMPACPDADRFLRDLAELNGGQYERVSR